MTILERPETAIARAPTSVNGVVISRQAIAREAQHHPASGPGDAIRLATEALVIRELLLQRARPRAPESDAEGRRQTREEASIRALIDRDVVVPQPTAAELARYYEANRHRFRSPAVSHASHILILARHDDTASYAAAREQAEAILAELKALPERFADLAKTFSNCPSAKNGGHLGRLLPGDTTPEFEAALAALREGETTAAPVETRYGFHIIRLDRRLAGQAPPFSAVAGAIADFLAERSRRLALAQYVEQLVAAADIAGFEMKDATARRVN